jgi:hypothetical protein
MKIAVIVAIGVLIASFGLGFFVARRGQEKPAVIAPTNPALTNEPAEDLELQQCREELAKAMLPKSVASAVDAAPSPEEEKISQLEEEFRQCRKRDTLDKAELCVTSSRYFPLLFTTLQADGQCEDRFMLQDLILRHTEKCVHFEDQTSLEELDLGMISESEASTLHDAQRNGKPPYDPRIGDQKARYGRHFKRTMRECYEKFGVDEQQ